MREALLNASCEFVPRGQGPPHPLVRRGTDSRSGAATPRKHLEQIRTIHRQTRGTYGSPRVTAAMPPHRVHNRVPNQCRAASTVTGLCDAPPHTTPPGPAPESTACAALGYARVATAEQHLHLQVDALTAAGCWRVVTDTAIAAARWLPAPAEPRPGPAPPRRHPGGLEARPARPVPAPPGRHPPRARRSGFRSLREVIDTTTTTT